MGLYCLCWSWCFCCWCWCWRRKCVVGVGIGISVSAGAGVGVFVLVLVLVPSSMSLPLSMPSVGSRRSTAMARGPIAGRRAPLFSFTSPHTILPRFNISRCCFINSEQTPLHAIKFCTRSRLLAAAGDAGVIEVCKRANRGGETGGVICSSSVQ